jgi:hypothetical protein
MKESPDSLLNNIAWIGALILFALCVLIRYPMLLNYKPHIFPDSGGYIGLAEQIKNRDFSNYLGQRTPIYPLVLLLMGLNLDFVMLFQSILGILISLMVFDLTFKYTKAVLVSFIVGLCCSLFLNLLFFEANILTETVSTFFVVLSVWCYEKMKYPKTKWLVIGLLSGLASLTRPQLLIMMPAFMLMMAFHYLYNRSAIKQIGINLALFLTPIIILVFGWSFFNYSKVGYFGLTTFTGYNLTQQTGAFIEYAPHDFDKIVSIFIKYREKQIEKTGDSSGTIWRASGEMLEKTGLTWTGLSNKLTGLSLILILEHPDKYLIRVVHSWINYWRIAIYWDLSLFSDRTIRFINFFWLVETKSLLLIHLLFLIFVCWLFYLMIHEKNNLNDAVVISAILVMLSSTSQAFLEYGENARYSIPFQPLIFFVVCVMFYRLAGKIKKSLKLKR